jgi:hypothetical protein
MNSRLRCQFEFCKIFGDRLGVSLNSKSILDLNSVFLRLRGEFQERTPDISNQIKTTCINHVGIIILIIKKQKNKRFLSFFINYYLIHS